MNHDFRNGQGFSVYGFMPDYGYMMEKKELKRNANIVAFGMLLLYGLSYIIGFLLYWWINIMLPWKMISAYMDILYNSITLTAYIISFLVPCIIMTRLIRIPVKVAYPMRLPNAALLIPGIFCCLGCTIIGGYLTEFVSTFVQTTFHVVPVMPDLSPPTDKAAFIIYLLNVVLAPAFLEEMMFRGVIMQSLRRFGDGFALIVSAVLFAMAHGNLVQGPNTLVMGLAIGFFVLRSGSLWTGIVIHFLNNGIAIALEFAFKYTDTYYWLENFLNSAIFLVYIAGGITAFFYLINTCSGLFKLAPSPSVIAAKHRFAYFFASVFPILLIIATIVITAGYFEPA